jgi:hypothetical protein
MKGNQVTMRNVAKLLTKRLPLDDAERTAKVTEVTKVLERLPESTKLALRTAYIFGRKVPTEEREDMFMTLFLTLWQAELTDERFAYTTARGDWRDWWQAYAYRQHYSLDSVLDSEQGDTINYAELLVGEVEFENRINGKVDAERLYSSLPNWVKGIVDKRLSGKGIRGGDRKILDKWIAKKPLILASYQR